MSESIDVELPVQFTHSLKVENTAKGIRISVHVYTNDQATAIEQVFQTYLKARMEAIDNKIPLAPVEGGKQAK